MPGSGGYQTERNLRTLLNLKKAGETPGQTLVRLRDAQRSNEPPPGPSSPPLTSAEIISYARSSVEYQYAQTAYNVLAVRLFYAALFAAGTWVLGNRRTPF